MGTGISTEVNSLHPQPRCSRPGNSGLAPVLELAALMIAKKLRDEGCKGPFTLNAGDRADANRISDFVYRCAERGMDSIRPTRRYDSTFTQSNGSRSLFLAKTLQTLPVTPMARARGGAPSR